MSTRATSATSAQTAEEQAVTELVDAVSVIINDALEQLLAHGVRKPALPLQLAELHGVLACFGQDRGALRHIDNIALMTKTVRDISWRLSRHQDDPAAIQAISTYQPIDRTKSRYEHVWREWDQYYADLREEVDDWERSIPENYFEAGPGRRAFDAISELLDTVDTDTVALRSAACFVSGVVADSWHELNRNAARLAGEVIGQDGKNWLEWQIAHYLNATEGLLDILQGDGFSSLPTPFRALAGALTVAVRVEPGMSDYDRLVRLQAQVTEITRAVLDADPDHVPSTPQRMGL